MDPITLAYIAGAMDADGTFFIERRRPSGAFKTTTYRICCAIQMAEREAIEFIAKSLGAKPMFRDLPNMNYADRIPRKPAYRLQWQCAAAAKVITLIEPYLHGKKEQARICLEFQDQVASVRTGRKLTEDDLQNRENFRLRVVALNKPNN